MYLRFFVALIYQQLIQLSIWIFKEIIRIMSHETGACTLSLYVNLMQGRSQTIGRLEGVKRGAIENII